MKNIFTRNRFQRFAEKKQDNGISIIIYYDSKEKRFVKSKNRYREATSAATIAIGSSALDKFEQKYGDPWGNIFSAKVNIYLLILFPLIDIVINGISNYIDNNKESEFAYIHLTIEEAKKIYWKSWIKDILMSLSIIADVKRLGEEYTKEIEFNKDINVATNTFVLAVDQTELVVMDLILNFASIIKLWADSQD